MSEITESQKSEIDVHLSEYKALSEFQRDAKGTFVKVAMYHNTGIVIIVTWILKQSNDTIEAITSLVNSGYFLPIMFILPIINAVLIIACAYQIYSFYCVALHFQSLRLRLNEILENDVLKYEDKFGRLIGGDKQLSIALDVLAAAMWFVIPLTLAISLILFLPSLIDFQLIKYSRIAYWFGSAFSLLAILYLTGVVVILLRTKGGYEQFSNKNNQSPEVENPTNHST